MKNNYKLYACEWAPNGCNDLIVTDENGKYVDSIAEAFFGINVGCNYVYNSMS